jgi:hypothetical protein
VYWDRSPTLAPAVLERAAVALADRLRAVEETAPTPAGLQGFGAKGR